MNYQRDLTQYLIKNRLTMIAICLKVEVIADGSVKPGEYFLHLSQR